MSGLPSVSYNKINDPFPDGSRGLLRDGRTDFFMFVYFLFFFFPDGKAALPCSFASGGGSGVGMLSPPCRCPGSALPAAPIPSPAPSPPTSPAPSPPSSASSWPPASSQNLNKLSPHSSGLLASLGKLPCRGCKGSRSGLDSNQQHREDEWFPRSTSQRTQTTRVPQSLPSEQAPALKSHSDTKTQLASLQTFLKLSQTPGKGTRVGQCPLREGLAGARNGLQDPNPHETLSRKPHPLLTLSRGENQAGFN